MELTDILASMGGLKSMSGKLGVSEGQAREGAEALLPAIVGGFKKQAQGQPLGIDSLGGLLGQLGGGSLLDQVLGSQRTDIAHGNEVLGEIFGSRDVSRTVAQSAAAKTGIDSSLLKQMLPMLAMMVAGYLAKQQAGAAPAAGDSGGMGAILGGLMGVRSDAGQGDGPVGGIERLLDMNGDGNALDDILRIAGKAIR